MTLTQNTGLVESLVKANRGYIIGVLQGIQKAYGYLPRGELEAFSRASGIPLSRIYSVATFYHQFRLDPPGRVTIWVCMGTACHLRGNAENYEYLRNLLKIPPGGTTSRDGLFTVEKARCFGCCSLAPVVKIGDKLIGNADPKKLARIIAQMRKELLAEARTPDRRGRREG